MRPGGSGNHYCVVDRLSFALASVLAIESLHAAGGIYQFLLAGKERVAIGTYFESDLRLSGPGLPGFTAGTMDGRVYVFRMNIGLHCGGHSCCEFFHRSNVKG